MLTSLRQVSASTSLTVLSKQQRETFRANEAEMRILAVRAALWFLATTAFRVVSPCGGPYRMLGASLGIIEEIMDPRARPSECQTKRFARSSLQHHPDNPAVLQIDGSTTSSRPY